MRAGVVYKDANVTVTAFATKHAMESYGYRFDTADRSIVISGDTNPTQATIDACNGCDVLIHEVLTLEWLAKRPDFQAYAAKHHTNDGAAHRAREQGQAAAPDPLSRIDFAATGRGLGAVDAGRVAQRDVGLQGPGRGGARSRRLLMAP